MSDNNLQNNDSKKQRNAAKSKKGMHYYTQNVKLKFVRSRNLLKSIKNAQARHAHLMEKANVGIVDEDGKKEVGLAELEIKELSAINAFLNKFLDKTFATQIESKNENLNYDNVVINTVQPDDPDSDSDDG